MTVKKTGLTIIMFVFAMTSAVSVYSQSDYMLVSGKTMSFDERQQEIFQQVKTCIGTENIRIIQSKSFDVVWEWAKRESRNNRHVRVSHDNTTMNQVKKVDGVFWAISLPNNKVPKQTRNSKEYQKAQVEMIKKMETCFAAESIYAIETADKEILEKWIKAEEEGRPISTSFNEETGVYTAVSSPKTDGQGKVMFRKID